MKFVIPPLSSYDDLFKRITRQMQQADVDRQILSILQLAYDKELGQTNYVLSRSERNRLFRQVVQAILAEVQSKAGGAP